MTPGKPSPFDDRTAEDATISLGWTEREREIIARRLAGQPLPAGGPHAVPPPPPARDVAPASRRKGRLTAQAAVLIVLGITLLAFLMAALASNERSDTSAPRAATRPPAEASRAAAASPPFDGGPTAGSAGSAGADALAAPSGVAPTRSDTREPPSPPSTSDAGEAVVRAFYGALGRGAGAEASALVVAEKRSSRAFSAQAISRFYGGLREPLRLTAITPVARDAYHVNYRYSAGRSRCDGQAVVRLTSRDGRDLIRSIQALSGC